jgi:hypothetical protein
MWRIKRRRTKPKTEGNKVIYPKLNATAKPNRYQSRNTYLDVKCNKELGAGCTDVGCQNTIDACGNFYSCKTAPYRNPILGYRKHLVDACQRALSGFVSGSVGTPPPSNNTLMYSLNGSNWVGLGNSIFGQAANSIKWNGKIWVAVGGYRDTNTLAYSCDGINWIGIGDPFSLSTNNGFGIDVASNGSDWMAVSEKTILKSANGINWVQTSMKPSNSFTNFGIAYGQNKWLVFGEDPSNNNIWYSTNNGDLWTPISMVRLLSTYADRGFYNGSLWVAVGTGTNNIIYSADGIIWTAGNNVGITGVAQDVFYNGSLWVAGGEGGQPLVWSDDGINWNNAVNQPLSIVNGVTWNSSINLWVATNGNAVSQYDFAYSADGKNWTGVPKDTNLLNTGTGNYLGSGNINLSGCGYTKDVSGNVYKDNYAKTCATHPEACYNQIIQTKQNKNGCVNESYNYSTNQYLFRRCLKFQQQEFNFLSQVPVDASGSCNCDCSANGFCTGINKLPCEVKNTKCYAIYKRSNSKFNHQGAVSGGSRINRLKYQTRMTAQGRTVNGRNNVINGRRPATLYRTSKPLTMDASGCWLNKDRTYGGLSQRCIVTNPCC